MPIALTATLLTVNPAEARTAASTATNAAFARSCNRASRLVALGARHGGTVSVAQAVAALTTSRGPLPAQIRSVASHRINLNDLAASEPSTDTPSQGHLTAQTTCAGAPAVTKLANMIAMKPRAGYILSVLASMAAGVATEAACMATYGAIITFYGPALAAASVVTEVCYFVSTWVDSFVFQEMYSDTGTTTKGVSAGNAFLDAFAAWGFFRGLDKVSERYLGISLAHLFAAFGTTIASLVTYPTREVRGRLTAAIAFVAEELGAHPDFIRKTGQTGSVQQRKAAANVRTNVFGRFVNERSSEDYGSGAPDLLKTNGYYLYPDGKGAFRIISTYGCLENTGPSYGAGWRACNGQLNQSWFVGDNHLVSRSGGSKPCLGPTTGGSGDAYHDMYNCNDGYSDTNGIDINFVPENGEHFNPYLHDGWNLTGWANYEYKIY